MPSDKMARKEQDVEGAAGRRRQRTRGRKSGGLGTERMHSEAQPFDFAAAANLVLQPPALFRRSGRRRGSSWGSWDSFDGTSKGPLERLNRDLQARLAESAPRAEHTEAIARCVAELQDSLSHLGGAGDWSLELFGSAANGFAVRGSDVDVTCLSLAHLQKRHRCSSDLSDLTREKVSENDEKENERTTNKEGGEALGKDAAEASSDVSEVDASTEEEDGVAPSSAEDGDLTDARANACEEAAAEEAQAEAAKGEQPAEVAREEPGQPDRRDGYLDPQAVLRGWINLLSDHKQLKVVEHVLFAKVPIVKVKFDDCVEVDLSVQNWRALQNTKLLHAYSNLHPKVRDLVIAVKLWAKGAHVCGASQHHLSSYTFALLTLYFLQVNPDVRLPCLPTSAFEAGHAGELDEHVKALGKAFVIHQSTAELLINFFIFYNYCFAWGREVASIRLGARHLVDEPNFEHLQGRWTPRMHIEDPYLHHRNLHCVLGIGEELQLRTAFAEAMQGLSCCLLPRGLEPSATAGVDDVISAPVVAKTSTGRTQSTADATTTSCDDAAGGSGGEVSSFSDGDEDDEGKYDGQEGFQWWRNLSSTSVKAAMRVGRQPRTVRELEQLLKGEVKGAGEGSSKGDKPRCLMMKDLEERIGEPTAPKVLLVSGFSSKCTKGIAAKFGQLCGPVKPLDQPVPMAMRLQ